MLLTLQQLLFADLVGARPVDLAVAAASIAGHIDRTSILAQMLEGVGLATRERHHLLQVAVGLGLLGVLVYNVFWRENITEVELLSE